MQTVKIHDPSNPGGVATILAANFHPLNHRRVLPVESPASVAGCKFADKQEAADAVASALVKANLLTIPDVVAADLGGTLRQAFPAGAEGDAQQAAVLAAVKGHPQYLDALVGAREAQEAAKAAKAAQEAAKAAETPGTSAQASGEGSKPPRGGRG